MRKGKKDKEAKEEENNEKKHFGGDHDEEDGRKKEKKVRQMREWGRARRGDDKRALQCTEK